MEENKPPVDKKKEDRIDPATLEKIMGLIKEFMKSQQRENERGDWIFAGLTVTLLGSLIFLAWHEILPNVSVAALFGIIIGYTIGKN